MGGWRFLPRAEARGLRARRTMTALSYPNRNPPIAAAAAIITTWAMFTSPLLGASPVVDTSLLARFSPWPDLDHEHGPPCGSVPLAETAGFTPCLGAGVSGAEARGSDSRCPSGVLRFGSRGPGWWISGLKPG